MPAIIVSAPEGVRAKVRVQTKTAHQGFDDKTGEPIYGWQDASMTTMASEARSFEVAAGQRIVVESDG